MASVRENCPCGAVMDYSGKYPTAAVDAFRFDHLGCRLVWQKSLTLAPLDAHGLPLDSEQGKADTRP